MNYSTFDTYAPRVALLPLVPVLLLQGRYVRRVTPLLPEAAGPSTGVVPGEGLPLSLLVLGESTVAGVGAPDHARALTGQLAQALAARAGHPVRWRALGRSGYTAARARRRLLPELPAGPVDAVVLALGVNDTLQGRAPARWADDLASLIAGVREQVGQAPVLLASVPPMGMFPALPQPLRWAMGWRAATLARAAARLAPSLARVRYSAAQLDSATGFFCADRFHPSVEGYRVWGGLLAAELMDLLSFSPGPLP